MLPPLVLIVSLKIMLLSMIVTALGSDAPANPPVKETGIKDTSVKGCPARLFGNSKNTESNTKAECSKRQALHDAPENPPEHGGCRILVFVSFSMPEASLKSLAQEAMRDQDSPCPPILVMRGLYEDSFAKTAGKLKDLGISVEINPELFEAYQITAVPTFVSVQGGKPLHRLKGNVTLAFVKETFAGQGTGEQAEEGAAP